MEARAGPHGALWPKCRVKVTPRRARALRCGVLIAGCPSTPRQSPRHWSAMMNSTFLRAAIGGASSGALLQPGQAHRQRGATARRHTMDIAGESGAAQQNKHFNTDFTEKKIKPQI